MLVERTPLEPRRRVDVIGIGAERAPQERDLRLDVVARRPLVGELDEQLRRARERLLRRRPAIGKSGEM